MMYVDAFKDVCVFVFGVIALAKAAAGERFCLASLQAPNKSVGTTELFYAVWRRPSGDNGASPVPKG